MKSLVIDFLVLNVMQLFAFLKCAVPLSTFS